MIASLPMYDWPELREATDALWADIRAGLTQIGISAPKHLSREMAEESTWLHPDLLLGQTCGYPFSTVLKEKVRYVATPTYLVQGCKGPTYSSAIVVRKDSALDLASLAGARLAFNSLMSLSGYRALAAVFGDPQKHFGSLIQSGSHRQSARNVAECTADIAAIDAVCWHLLNQHELETASQLKVIGWTKNRPALPFITSLNTSDDTVDGLRQVLSEVTSRKKAAMLCNEQLIGGCEIVDLDEYAQLSSL